MTLLKMIKRMFVSRGGQYTGVIVLHDMHLRYAVNTTISQQPNCKKIKRFIFFKSSVFIRILVLIQSM